MKLFLRRGVGAAIGVLLPYWFTLHWLEFEHSLPLFGVIIFANIAGWYEGKTE